MSGVYLARCGLASALGPDLPAALLALRAGHGAPGRVTLPDGAVWPHYRMPTGDGDWLTRLRRTLRRVADECAAFDLRAAPLLVASSSLDMGMEESQGRFPGDMSSFADAVAAALAWRGPVLTVSNACTSSLNAVLAACELLAAGDAAEAVVLGIEFDNCFSLAGFAAMQLLSPGGARPLGAGRDGLVLGDAVAMLCLSRHPARWRIAGGANVVQGRNATGVDAGAVAAMCHAALAHSGLAPADIDLVKVHAAGSREGDAAEVAGLQQVFEPLPPMVSFKAAIGHTLGAAGAAEIALLSACVDGGVWPRRDYPLDECPGLVLNMPPAVLPRRTLLSSFGFGGGHAALVLERGGA